MRSTRVSINLHCCSSKLFRSSDFTQGHAVNSVWDYSFGCPFPSIFSNSWRECTIFHSVLHACRELILDFLRLLESILLPHIFIIVKDTASQVGVKFHKVFGAWALSIKGEFCEFIFWEMFNDFSKQSIFFSPSVSRFPEFSPAFQSGCLPGYLGAPGCILLGMNYTSASYNTSLERYFLGQTGCYCDFFTTRTWPHLLNFSLSIITAQLWQNGIGLGKGWFLPPLKSAARFPLTLVGGRSNL